MGGGRRREGNRHWVPAGVSIIDRLEYVASDPIIDSNDGNGTRSRKQKSIVKIMAAADACYQSIHKITNIQINMRRQSMGGPNQVGGRKVIFSWPFFSSYLSTLRWHSDGIDWGLGLLLRISIASRISDPGHRFPVPSFD